MTTNYLYAAYGSNLHPMRLVQRVPSAKLIGTGIVPGFGLRFHKRSLDGSAKCDIVEADSDIHVAVFDIPFAEKPLLDKVEGLGSGYDEKQIAVPGFGDCQTYKAAETHIDPALTPYSWYKALVLVGSAFNNFTKRYIQSIQDVSDQRDPDEQRHAKNMALVEAMRRTL